jgi:hypothetical protein
LRSPGTVAGLSLPLRLVWPMKCILCADVGWVCENHPLRPWDRPHGCDCGGAGMPWMADDGAAPRMPEGFKTDVDKKGWRH